MGKKKIYSFNCLRCFFHIDHEEQRMQDHCLKSHGVTGQFGKGYKKSIKYIDDGKPIRKPILRL